MAYNCNACGMYVQDSGHVCYQPAADPRDATISTLRAECEALRVDAERYQELIRHREWVFRDDSDLWVASWKRASGNAEGIIGSRIDAALAAAAKEG